MHRIDEFRALAQRSDWLTEAMEVARELQLPDYYVAGGAVTQVVWNQLVGRPIHQMIKDVDVIYFDRDGGLPEQLALQRRFVDLTGGRFPIDLTNQALVHQWYDREAGETIEPYQRVEDGIDVWLSAFAVGIRIAGDRWDVYAPYGLSDLLDKRVRPNRKQITETTYQRLVASYRKRWPTIEIEAWTDSDR